MATRNNGYIRLAGGAESLSFKKRAIIIARILARRTAQTMAAAGIFVGTTTAIEAIINSGGGEEGAGTVNGTQFTDAEINQLLSREDKETIEKAAADAVQKYMDEVKKQKAEMEMEEERERAKKKEVERLAEIERNKTIDAVRSIYGNSMYQAEQPPPQNRAAPREITGKDMFNVFQNDQHQVETRNLATLKLEICWKKMADEMSYEESEREKKRIANTILSEMEGDIKSQVEKDLAEVKEEEEEEEKKNGNRTLHAYWTKKASEQRWRKREKEGVEEGVNKVILALQQICGNPMASYEPIKKFLSESIITKRVFLRNALEKQIKQIRQKQEDERKRNNEMQIMLISSFCAVALILFALVFLVVYQYFSK